MDSLSPSYQGSPWNHVPSQVCKVCHNYNFHWCDSLSIFVSPNCLDEGQGQVLSYSWLLAQCLGCDRWTVTFVQRDGWMVTWILLVDPMAFKENSWLFELQWHPTPVLLPGKSHGWRSLVGCSPWGCEELDTTGRLPFHFSLSCIGEGNGNLLQCSCLENPRDGGAWWAAVYGIAQSWTRLKWLSSSSLIETWPRDLGNVIEKG